MPISKIILAIFLVFTCGNATAQSRYFRHYQVEQGLSNNTVFACAQDKKGFFWMGTKDGLNRFDGYTFKIFRNDPEDSTTIGDNFIRSLLIDSSDNLYAGTRNGLYRFDAASETFSAVVRTTNEIRDIKRDMSGLIWFVSGQTLMNYNENTKAVQVFDPQKYFNATSVCIDDAGTIWIATATGFLQEYHVNTNSFTAYNLFKGSQPSTSKWIEKIYAATGSLILAGTSNYGVKLFDSGDSAYRDILTYNNDKTEIFARDFIQSSGTEFWMATESGIFIYDTKTGNITNLKKHYNNPYSLSDNAVYCLYKDKEGGIWAGTYFGGANYYSRQYTSFEKFLPDYTSHSLSGNAVREICEDKYGNLWIGTEDAGLNKLDRRTGLFTHFKPTGTSTGISYSNIHGLLARNDELWIGTFEHGLNIMDIRSGKVIKHFPGSQDSKKLKSNFIVTICQTKNGETFIGTRQGLYSFDGENSFTAIRSIPSSAFIHAIMEDNKGLLWIGTMGSGLYCYDPLTEKTWHFSYDQQNKKGISNNSITTIFQDSRGRLWLGTEGGGLNQFVTADSSFTVYKTRQGLPANTIFKILEDNRGNLWVTTTKGLVCFNPASRKIDVYTTASGLLSDQFNYNSGYKDATGKMYFGSVKGLISFNPDTFIENEFRPPLFITSIVVNNKELKVHPGSPLKRSVLFTERIDLSHDQSTFSIDFAALSFTAPELTEYKYIMEGLDEQWTHLKANRKVYFTNLSPGTYTFRVNAVNYRGTWNNRETKLIIKIHPPFWASGPAYLLYFLVAAALVYFLFQNYHRRVAERNNRKIEVLQHEKEKEVYQAKIDFFTNVAHEIRTPLTLIKAPLEKIIKKAGEPGIDPNLRIMEKNTERLIELTNQLLDFSKVETKAFHLNFVKTNISEMLSERYESFKALAELKSIRLSLQMPEKPIIAYVDPDSLHKILNNLFYNALNYGKTRVNVRLKDAGEQDFFKIEFSNDGNLVPAAMREKIFEPFYRLHETINRPGTGIGLTLSRSLATLHKGELYLEDSPGESNIFVVSLPIHQNGSATDGIEKPVSKI